MTSILVSATQAAHSAAASLLSKAQIAPGGVIPSGLKVKENEVETPFELVLTGKHDCPYIIVADQGNKGVPAAFSGTCSNQAPQYVEKLAQFKERGVKDIYVVAVNDAFVTKAWKEKLNGQGLHFVADDTGAFTSSIGMMFDATPLLGAPRSKRYAIVTNGMTVETVAVEPDPTKITVTGADAVLATL